MAVDPIITPLAAFGLATAILNYMINTIQNLHGKYHEIKDFPDVFRRYALIVYDCQQSYKLWQRLWHRPNEASYDKLFGKEGWTAIKACKQDIERLCVDAANILSLRVSVAPTTAEESTASTGASTFRRVGSYMKSALQSSRRRVMRKGKPYEAQDLHTIPLTLESNDPQQWQLFTGGEAGIVMTYKPEELVFKRITGLLGPNQNLKNKITDLEKASANLAKRTATAFQLMGHGPEPKEPDEVEAADNTVQFRAVARNLGELIRTQFTANGDGGAWFLELEFPEAASDSSDAVTQIIRNCSISFVASACPLGERILIREIKLKRLRGLLETEDTDITELEAAMATIHTKRTWTVSMPGHSRLAVYQLDWADPPPDLLMKDWRTLLGACSRDQSVRKALELERARLALRLTLWFILLWETDWFAHVCSCAFRCVLFSLQTDDGNRPNTDNGENGPGCRQEHVYATLRLDANATTTTPVIPEDSVLHETRAVVPLASCRGKVDLQHRLYHFGMLLAELALATPIHLSSDLDRNPRMDSPGYPVDTFRRIRDIQNHRDMPPQLKEAIEFCFDNSKNDKWSTESKDQAAHRVKDFINGVVKPVEQYHKVVKENFKFAQQFSRLAQEYQDDEYDLSQIRPSQGSQDET